MTEQLAGPRNLAAAALVWPNAAGIFTTLPDPPPKTITYVEGPVPKLELIKTGAPAVMVPLQIGETMEVPFDGVAWRVRCAVDGADLSLNKTGAGPAVVTHAPVILLDAPYGFKTPGRMVQDHVIATADGDVATVVLNVPIGGMQVSFWIGDSQVLVGAGTFVANCQYIARNAPVSLSVPLAAYAAAGVIRACAQLVPDENPGGVPGTQGGVFDRFQLEITAIGTNPGDSLNLHTVLEAYRQGRAD